MPGSCGRVLGAGAIRPGEAMTARRAIIAAAIAAVFVAGSVSNASARWFHHRGRGAGPGVIGGLIVGAATIATLPLALLAGAASSGPRRYEDQGDAYGPPPAPPPRPYRYGYGSNYGPAPAYDYRSPQGGGYGPQQGYEYGPPQAYGPPAGYGNDPGYYGPPRYGYGPPPGYYGYGR